MGILANIPGQIKETKIEGQLRTSRDLGKKDSSLLFGAAEYVPIYIYTYLHLYICIYAGTICVYIHTHIYIYTYVYVSKVCIYTYVYIHV